MLYSVVLLLFSGLPKLLFFDYVNHRDALFIFFFFFNDPPTTEIYTLSLHDALPISRTRAGRYSTRPRTRPGRWTAARTGDRKSTRLNSSHGSISYAVFCLKKKK